MAPFESIEDKCERLQAELARLLAIESAARSYLAAKKKVQGRKFSGSQFLEEAKAAEAEAWNRLCEVLTTAATP